MLNKYEMTHATNIESDQKTVALGLERIKQLVSDSAMTGDTLLLNMGPQHPSTHGVLRVLLELDGEVIVSALPDVGYLHTGIEKNMEYKTYEQVVTMTDRMDYINNMGNNLTYALAVEKLIDLDVPMRAQYLRVILAELQRINNHLVWLATHILDLGATSVMLYGFADREHILEIFEMISGQRMMTSYIRPGGVWRDVPDDFAPAVRAFLEYFPPRLADYHKLLDKNPIFLGRTKDIAIVPKEVALNWSVSGPLLRGSGVAFDLRKAHPYSSYDHFDFDVPTGDNCDMFDRYMVRMEEMTQSLRIIEQALDRLPDGPFRSENRKFVPPPRSELGTSMEALIHHFKFWTEGIRPPKGEVHAETESPKGILSCYLASDGGPHPYRVHFRTPSLWNLQSLEWIAPGYMIADMVGIIGSIDIALGDCDR